MNEVKIFESEEFGSVRTVEEDGKMLFCGSDVAKALGYTRPNDAVNDHCRIDATSKRRTIIDRLGRKQEALFIPEGDVYRLIAHSKLPAADQFERWIFDDVIPTIRKTGGYVNNDELFIETYFSQVEESTKAMLRATLATVREVNEKNRQLEQTVGVQSQQIAELQPKATYYDVVLQCEDLISITAIAKDYGKSARWMNNYLHEKGVQYRQGDIWLLYQTYAERGYTSTKTFKYDDGGENHVKVHTYWTQKGRLFIYELMKSDGHLPIIEQENGGECA
nr:MAG TPA: repressor domain protein [Caudoviricetes sp.]